jgi:polysaccharide biosynthesis transport protein
MEIRQYFNVLLKWWWLIVISVLIASAVSLASALTTPRTYMSRTTLMVGQALQDPNPNQSEFYTGQALAQSYADMVKREPVLRQALAALNLDWNWELLQSMVSSRVVPGTQLLEISVLDSDPQRAKYLVEEIVQQLILQSPAGSNTEREAERQFTLQQVEDLKANITKGQDEIRKLDDVVTQATSARQIQDARSRQAALQSQIATWQATYAQLMTSLQQGTTNILSVVELPQIPTSSVSTGTATNVLLAAVIGLVLAVSAAYLLEYLDDSMQTPDDIRTLLDLPTLATIARIEADSAGSKLILTRPRDPIAESYRTLRTNLQFTGVDHPLTTLVITSASPGEGKSLLAANLAIIFAQAGKRVVLVDADMRQPTQHTLFELRNEVGLTSVLLPGGNTVLDALQSVAPNLQLLPSGPIPPNPAEMLGSHRMQELIGQLRSEADLVIFDTPPVMVVTDPTILATHADGALLVIDAGRTLRGEAKHSTEALKAVGAHLLGIVLNRYGSRTRGGYAYYYSADRTRSRRPRTLRERVTRRIRPAKQPDASTAADAAQRKPEQKASN